MVDRFERVCYNPRCVLQAPSSCKPIMSTDNNAFPFTHPRLEAIKPPRTGRASYRDTKVAGLTLAVTTSGSQSFYFYKRIEGKPTRIRIGGFPEISIDDARKEAQKFSGEIARGENPVKTKHTKTKP